MGDLTWLPEVIQSPAQFVVGALFCWLIYRPIVLREGRRADRAEESSQRFGAAFSDLADQVRLLVDLIAAPQGGTGRHRRDG